MASIRLVVVLFGRVVGQVFDEFPFDTVAVVKILAYSIRMSGCDHPFFVSRLAETICHCFGIVDDITEVIQRSFCLQN